MSRTCRSGSTALPTFGVPSEHVLTEPQLTPSSPRGPNRSREVVVAGLVRAHGARAVEVEHRGHIYGVHQFVKIDHSAHADTLVELGPQPGTVDLVQHEVTPALVTQHGGRCQTNLGR